MNNAASVPGLPRLEKYELLEEIGHGGMATVYRARDPRLSRDVAVKVIHKHLRENSEVATRFVAEARAAAKLRHKGIVEVFDVSNEDDAERYLVVELIRGSTLRKVLKENREMPPEVGAAIVLQLCEALEHAHEEGIIHRDVKPENVLVELPADREAWSAKNGPVPSSNPGARERPRAVPKSEAKADAPADDAEGATPITPTPSDTQRSKAPEGGVKVPAARKSKRAADRAEKKAKSADASVVIKLTDFGIAKILDAQGVTSTGQVLGSPAHMAPEQIEGGEVDARTDVFALGVLMYECLVGHLPFEGKNPAQVLRRVLDGQYPQADRERPKVGGRWSKILARSLAREAPERTASPRELGEEIRAELDALGFKDPRAEIEAYFADPAGYMGAHEKRVLPKLVARGEAARKAGDIPGAAADFNRAVALAPNDSSILKRLTTLNSSRDRKVMLKRAAVIIGGSTALGLMAFAIVRVVKMVGGQPAVPVTSATIGPERPSADVPGPPTPSGIESTSAVPTGTPTGTTSSSARVKLPLITAPTTSASAAQAAATTRLVQFRITPGGGASLAIDGGPAKPDTQWDGAAFPLALGPHSASVTTTSPCCKAGGASFAVVASDDPHPQIVPITLELLPARVTFSASSGTVNCPGMFVLTPGQTQEGINLRSSPQNLKCEFTPTKGEKFQASVRLEAGVSNSIPWPAGH